MTLDFSLLPIAAFVIVFTIGGIILFVIRRRTQRHVVTKYRSEWVTTHPVSGEKVKHSLEEISMGML